MEWGTACLADGGAARVEPLATPGLELRTLPAGLPGSPVPALDERTRDALQREFLHPALQNPNPTTRVDVRLAVTNAGPGIPPEAFPCLYTPASPTDRASLRSAGACTRMFTILRVAAAAAAGPGGRMRP